MPRSLLAAVGLLLAACPSKSQDPPRAVATTPASAPKKATQAAAQPPPLAGTAEPTHLEAGSAGSSAAPRSAQRLEITAAQAKQHGLAPRRITLDLGASGLSPSILDEPGRYFHVSGPPGGPLGLELREQPARSERALIASIRAAHRIEEKDLSPVGTLQIQGKPWRAIAFVAGEGFSRSIHWVADRDGLTLHAFVDWRDEPLPADAIGRLTATRPFDHLLRTLEIE